MAAKFVPSPSGIAEIARAEEMQLMLKEKVDEAVETARDLAEPHVRSAHYQLSLFAASGEEGGFAVGRLGNTAAYAGFVEFGTSVMEAQAILRRAAEMTWQG